MYLMYTPSLFELAPRLRTTGFEKTLFASVYYTMAISRGSVMYLMYTPSLFELAPRLRTTGFEKTFFVSGLELAAA